MTTHKEAEAHVNDVLRPLLAARAAQDLDASRVSYRRARFALGATISIAVIYAGFIVLRFTQGQALDALNVIVVSLVILGAANAFKRCRSAKSALRSSEQSAAT